MNKIYKVILTILFFQGCESNSPKSKIAFQDNTSIVLQDKNLILGQKSGDVRKIMKDGVLNERLSSNSEECLNTFELFENNVKDSLYYLKAQFKDNNLIGITAKMAAKDFFLEIKCNSKDSQTNVLKIIDSALIENSVHYKNLIISHKKTVSNYNIYYKIQIYDTVNRHVMENRCWEYEWR